MRKNLYFPLVLLVSLLIVPTTSKFIFAEEAVTFKKVTVDPNVVPNKQFKISATVSVSASNGRDVQVSIKVPNEISVVGSVIVDLDRLSSGREDTATWTLIASETGSFPITLKAYSTDSDSGNSESSEFQFDVSVGLKGLVITGMNIPGNVIPNDDIAIVVKLKNTGASVINNIISQLAVPEGLHVMNDVSQNIVAIQPEEEIALTWNLKALNSGSYDVLFTYSSSDAGSASLQGTINVGIKSVADLRLSEVSIGQDGTGSLGPGDIDAPLNILLSNSGNHALHDVSATLVLEEPFTWTNPQPFNTKLIDVGQSAEATYFINVDQAATPGIYIGKLSVSFLDGNEQINTTYDLPLEISANIVISALANKLQMEPDSSSPVILDVINNGDKVIHGLSVSTASDQVSTPAWVGDLAPLETKSVTLNVYTSSETLSDPRLMLVLDYESDGRKFTQTKQVDLQFIDLPNFGIRSIAVEPGLAYPGDTQVKLDIKLVNSGYVGVNGLTAALRLPEGITPAWGGSTTIFLGKLVPGEERTVSFFVNVDSNADTGLYQIMLDLQNDIGLSSLNVDFIISQKAKFELIEVSDADLYPGASNVPLKIMVKNTGSIAAEELTTQFVGGNAIPGVKSNTVTSIGNIENIGIVVPEQVITTNFIVNVDPASAPGAQATNIEITWSQHGKMFAQTLVVPFEIANGPSYLLYYQGIPWAYVIGTGLIAVAIAIFVMIRRRRISLMVPSIADAPQPPRLSPIEQEGESTKIDKTKKGFGI